MSLYFLAGLDSNFLSSSSVTFSGDTDDANFPHENIANGKPWEIMKFAAAGTDDYIHAALTSSVSADFCSVHMHNLSTSMVIELRRGAAGGTLVATMTREEPSFFSSFASASDDEWRLLFDGTSTSATYIGEWVLGAANTLTQEQKWGWSISYKMPQNRLVSPSGLVLTHNLNQQRLRGLNLSFVTTSDSNLSEHLDDMLTGCAWGEEPLVVVPDSDRNIVLHGRPTPEIKTTISPGNASGIWKHSIEITEDPGPIIVK